MAEHAARSPRHSHTHTRIKLRHKHAHQREARGRLLELHVGGALRDGEAHSGDDLALVQRGGVHAHKKVVCRNLAPVGDDRSPQAQHRAGVAGGGVVVGHGAPQRAACAHLPVSNASGQVGQGRNGSLHFAAGRHIGVARHGTNHQGIALAANARQLGNAVQINDLLRVGQAQAHGRQQTLSTGQQLAALGNELRGSGGGSRRFKGECVHGRISLCLGRLNGFPHAVGRCRHIEVLHAQGAQSIEHGVDHRGG